uniref:MurR/RpiR family transcriptional regulator n=1 Tax=Thaumasiovibrio occultus TaxID=1891184 RepID=UPI000B361DE7|nr:MurR/RpiR family transcriptional regulator [Thaumasiovibrio occultus]
MSGIVNKIKALLQNGNPNEQKISQYVIDHHFDLSKLSATKLGAELGMSDSSVIRYAKLLGCSGFPDLKLQLAAQAAQLPENDEKEIYHGIAASDSTAQIIEKSKALFTSKIEQSISLIDADTIEQCATLLLAANKVVLTGIGASALVASDINHKLIRAGLNIHFNPDYHTQIVQASLLAPGDVLIVVSARGNTPEVLFAMEKARDAGAKVMAITRFGKDKVAQLADFVIPYSNSEEHAQLGMVTSQLLMMISFDVLFFKLNTLIDSSSMSKALNSIRTIQN